MTLSLAGSAPTARRRNLARRSGSLAMATLLGLTASAGLFECTTATSASASPANSGTPRLIIDTDLSLWWDDATALGMANVLQQRGKIEILGIMSDVRNPVAAGAIDAIDTFYGHSKIPVGAVTDSAADTAPHGYSDVVAAQLPHAIASSAQAQPAVRLYRRLLASQPNHSVTVVGLGGDTNLAGLLRSGPGQGSALRGRALVAAKVKRLVIEDGLFPSGVFPPVTNEAIDIPATQFIVGTHGWPTPMAWVDGFSGTDVKVGASLCTTVPAENPMRIIYTNLFNCGPPGDGDWDGPTLLYAVEGTAGIFTELGQGGAAVINSKGGLSWGSGAHHPPEVYVHVVNPTDPTELNARINALIEHA
jgi:pyrimidine-specific ribonucleoside hydrolase